MSKKLLFLIVLLIPFFTNSCKKKELPKTLSPSTIEIAGNLGEYYELVDQEYTFPTYGSDLRLKFRRISEENPSSFSKAGMGIEVYDEDGKLIHSQEAELENITPFEWGSLLETKKDEIGSHTVYLQNWPDAYYGAKTFKITAISNTSE